ncbi:MAG: SCO family protein [Ignavibacteriaceae bacterium]
MKRLNFNIFLLFFLFAVNISFSADKKIEIGIDEQLGKTLPADVFFYDESGSKVLLKDLITKPTVLAFVYYKCPGICSPLLSELANVVGKVDLKPGESYNIITISMDEFETPEIAKNKKQNYLKIIKGSFPESSWKFLTGDSVNIKKTTDAAGFYFKKEGKQFIHTGSLIFISDKEKITRYLFPGYSDRRGFGILPFDFKMAVLETSKGKTEPTISRVLQYCFSYDPKGRTYMLNITRIFGAGILLLAVIFVGYLKLKPKKENLKKG